MPPPGAKTYGRCSGKGRTSAAATTGTVAAPVVAMSVGTNVVASAGLVTGLSGSGIMSGFASYGALVGGGAVAGMVVLSAAPGLTSVAIMNRIKQVMKPGISGIGGDPPKFTPEAMTHSRSCRKPSPGGTRCHPVTANSTDKRRTNDQGSDRHCQRSGP